MEIKCQNLTIGYHQTTVLDGINLTLPSGSYTCVVGENGVGKSTLIKTILGLIPPLSGKIVFGEELDKTVIGYMPQQTQIQKDFPASVWEVVQSGCINQLKFRCFYTRLQKQKVHEALNMLGISHLAKKSYAHLSGGQQQRVLLARALCATNQILVLDEPTAGLDLLSTQEFYRMIKKLNQSGTTIVMITHNLNESVADANFILELSKERVRLVAKEEYQEGK